MSSSLSHILSLQQTIKKSIHHQQCHHMLSVDEVKLLLSGDGDHREDNKLHHKLRKQQLLMRKKLFDPYGYFKSVDQWKQPFSHRRGYTSVEAYKQLIKNPKPQHQQYCNTPKYNPQPTNKVSISTKKSNDSAKNNRRISPKNHVKATKQNYHYIKANKINQLQQIRLKLKINHKQ